MTDPGRDEGGWGQQLGYQGEVYAEIQYVSNTGGNAFGTGVEGRFENELLMLGQISASPGDRVPVLPLNDDHTVTYDSESARVAICTDRAFWSPRYFRHLKNPSGMSRSALNEIKTALIKREGIPHRNAFARELTPNTKSIPLAEDAPHDLPTRYAPQLLDTDPDAGDTVEGVVNRVTRHGDAIVTINTSEYIMQEDTATAPGETLPVRIINSRTVVTPKQRDDVNFEPRGYPRECRAQVYATTNSDNTRVIGIDDAINGTTYLTGPLTVTIGAHVPIVPVRGNQDNEDYAVCTAPELWDADYTAAMTNITAPSKTQYEDLRDELRATARSDPSELPEIPHPGAEQITDGTIVRFSNNGNAVIDVNGSEYTLRDNADGLEVGDTVTVAVENTSFAHLANPANAEKTWVGPQPDAENGAQDPTNGDASADADADVAYDDGEAGGGGSAGCSESRNASSVGSSEPTDPTGYSECGDPSFYPGQTADGEVQHVRHDDDGDATVVVAVDDEEYTVREYQEDGADIAVEDGTRVIHRVTELDVGDIVTVRRIDATNVTLHGHQSDIVVDDAHSAVEEEVHVHVFEFTNDGHAYGIGTEGKLKGDIIFLGPLTCPRNTHVAATPIDAPVRGDKVAVCTDPAFWNDAYLDELARVTGLPRDRLETVRLNLESEPCNDTASPPENDSMSTPSDSAVDAESAHKPSESSRTTTEVSHGDESQHSSPNLTEEDESFISARRRERDQAFAQEVKDAYDERCAVCGARRVAPNGSIEVEAAHIYPKSEGGVDDVRNGVALCKLHHWAFDNGWLSISDDYDVIVRDAEDRDGYNEFSDLDGDALHLPDEENLRAHPKFLHQHRLLHGFEE